MKNREILFRGITESGELIYPDDKLFGGLKSYDILQRFDNVEQFTGLLDKNGKRIFEGDIIQLGDIDCPITWDDGGFQMITSHNQGKSPAIQDRVKNFEVIGTIHDDTQIK